MAHAECRKPPKLCRRTFFLRSGTAPTRSEMSDQLGGELADVILATLQPSQRAALPVDRMVLTEAQKSIVRGKDSDEVRGQIHDHIMKIGGNVSQRLEGYWRKRIRETATSVVTADDLDFVRFECNQRITIARDEERKRYERLLVEKEEELRCRLREEKGDLHRSYGKARALWGQFVCRKVRAQAKQLLCQIAARYRVKLEQELNHRLQQERARIVTEMEGIVLRALEHQRRTHEQMIEWLAYQYEEQLRFANEYSCCQQTVEIVRELCRSQQRPQNVCQSTQASASAILNLHELEGEPSEEDDSSSLTLYGAKSPSMCSAELSDPGMFIIAQCLAILDDKLKSLSNEEDSEVGQSEEPLQKDRQHYPKELFGDVQIKWKRMDPIASFPFARSVDMGREANIDQRSSGICTVPERAQISQEPLASVSSYRESYDAIAELNDVFKSRASDSSVEVVPDERFDALFDLKKSEDQIAEIADSIVPAYIQATDDDYVEMFSKVDDAQILKDSE